jgi:hypothetical protein
MATKNKKREKVTTIQIALKVDKDQDKKKALNALRKLGPGIKVFKVVANNMFHFVLHVPAKTNIKKLREAILKNMKLDSFLRLDLVLTKLLYR